MFNTLNFVWWNAVLVFVLEFIVVAMLISPSFTAKQLDIEFGYIQETMGEETMLQVKERARHWYKTAFIETGVYSGTFELVMPSNRERAASGGMTIGRDEVFPIVERQLKSMWLGILQITVRIVHLLVWMPFILMLAWPFIVDGVYQRKIAFMSFQHASAVRNRWSLRGAYLVLFVCCLVLLSPFAIPALFFPAMGLVTAMSIGVAIGNMQKRM